MRSVVSFPSRCRILVHAAITLVVACNSTAALGHAQDNKRSDAVSVISGTSVEQLTGIVEEIVIDDRVAHATYRYRELHLDDGTLVPLEGTATDALQSGSRVELTGHRHGRPMEVDAVRTLMQPQSTVAGSAAVEVEGTLSIAHSDDFTAERSRFVYEIQEDNGNHRRLNLATLPAPLRWGMRISVSGEPSSDGSSLRPSRITIIAAGPEEGGGSKRSGVTTKSANTVLVILANLTTRRHHHSRRRKRSR